MIKKSLQETIDDYLEYRTCMVKPSTLKRDRVALNQLRRFVGSSKAVEELSYKDIEGKNGLIQHLRSKGCSDVGINTSLRHIRTYVNWLFEKEKLIPEPIRFKELKKGVQLYHYFNESETNQIYHYINEHMDSSYLRYFHFYNQTGMRPTEPFIGELVGDWYLISGEDRKNGIPMQMQLNEELKSILLEMQSFRDTKLHCKDANVRVVDILERNIMRIVRALEFTGKRLTLYSFRHSYAIRRITITGSIHDVMREMGHSNTQTTMRYLRFPEQRRLDDFPSLKQYIENRQNLQKSGSMVTKSMVTQYLNIPNFKANLNFCTTRYSVSVHHICLCRLTTSSLPTAKLICPLFPLTTDLISIKIRINSSCSFVGRIYSRPDFNNMCSKISLISISNRICGAENRRVCRGRP